MVYLIGALMCSLWYSDIHICQGSHHHYQNNSNACSHFWHIIDIQHHIRFRYKLARRSNQSILKEINPGISLEGMMLKLKLQYFGHLMRRVDSLEKTLTLGGIAGQEEKGTTEDEMAGWHHRLDGWESEWTPRVGDGQGGLVFCDSQGRKESDTTERLNWTEVYR